MINELKVIRSVKYILDKIQLFFIDSVSVIAFNYITHFYFFKWSYIELIQLFSEVELNRY